MNIIISKHANRRIKERVKNRKDTIIQTVRKAWYRGYSSDNAKGTLKDYIDAFDSTVRVYQGYTYIFAYCPQDKEAVLITVIHLPDSLKKHSQIYTRRKYHNKQRRR